MGLTMKEWLGVMLQCDEFPIGKIKRPGWKCPDCGWKIGMIDKPKKCDKCGFVEDSDPVLYGENAKTACEASMRALRKQAEEDGEIDEKTP
jgi:hypothetical protein